MSTVLIIIVCAIAAGWVIILGVKGLQVAFRPQPLPQYPPPQQRHNLTPPLLAPDGFTCPRCQSPRIAPASHPAAIGDTLTTLFVAKIGPVPPQNPAEEMGCFNCGYQWIFNRPSPPRRTRR